MGFQSLAVGAQNVMIPFRTVREQISDHFSNEPNIKPL
jgi:hypothetical protein